MQTTRDLIPDESFWHRHRAGEKNFTRRRKLTFVKVVVLLLQKTVRSIPLHWHDFFAELAPGSPTVKASSWCQARLKLRHTAFLELQARAIVEVVQGQKSDFAVRRWKGHRLIGIASSLVRWPNEEALGQEFGRVQCSNPQGASGRQLYPCRWGVETFYGLVKGRLDLENFTGLSVEAVRQDVPATIFLSNLESILIQPVQERLRQKSEPLKNRPQVNHAVSFPALKSQIIQLLLSGEPIAEVLPKLQRLFWANPVSDRPNRKVPRPKKSAWRSYQYQRNTSVF